MIKILKKLLPILIIVIIFIFLIRNLILNWTKIPFEELHFNLLYLVIAFLVLIVHFVCYSKGWQKIMTTLGNPISLSQSLWIIATTQIARYLPGRVWYMIGRIYVGKKEKMDTRNLAVSMILETCLLLITSSIIFLLSTIVIGNYSTAYLLGCISLIIIVIIIMNPRVLTWITNFFLRLLKKPEIDITTSYNDMLKFSIYFFGLWIAQIIGFYFLIKSIYPIQITNLFNLAATYTLSWITGFVVIFAPGGLGIREGMMTLLLSPILPAPLAIAISFLARIWITVFEIIVFFIGLLVKRAVQGDKK